MEVCQLGKARNTFKTRLDRVITVAQHALRKVKHVLALADSVSLSFPFVCLYHYSILQNGCIPHACLHL